MNKIYLIHHSHTDIGYTNVQSLVEAWHIDYTKKALKNNDENFKWQIETFWALEAFLKNATNDEKIKLKEKYENNEIGISLNYLNMSELLNYKIHQENAQKIKNILDNLNIKVNAAMSADINGHQLSWANAMYDVGLRFLMTNIHTHHGMFPCFIKQRPFKWQIAENKEITVWNGDHYNLGNVLGLIPKTGKINFELQLKEANYMVKEYVNTLKSENYPYDFVPICASGIFVDNAPPNEFIPEFLKIWNKQNEIQIQMVTLNEFQEILEKANLNMPTYNGDWPDWWTDGAISFPDTTKIFRNTQDLYNLLNLVDNEKYKLKQKIVDNLTLYSEHTYSHSGSTFNPYNKMVNEISGIKKSRVLNALNDVHKLKYQIDEKLNAFKMGLNSSFCFQTINPHNIELTNYTTFEIEHYDWFYQDIDNKQIQILDEQNKEYKFAIEQGSRTNNLKILVNLQPKETKKFKIKFLEKEKNSIEHTYWEPNTLFKNDRLKGSDKVHDIVDKYIPYILSQNELIYGNTTIKWNKQGITNIQKNGKELLEQNTKYHFLTPIYDISKTEQNGYAQCEIRSTMGRNKKSINNQRNIGTIINIAITQENDLYITLEITHQLNGCNQYITQMKIYKNYDFFEIKVKIHKQSIWDAENLYINLNFKNRDKLLVDRNPLIQPATNQIPGTLIDYIAIQSGFIIEDTIMLTKDTPMLQLSSIDFQTRTLAPINENKELMIWVMSNYWETNFNVDLGGFHEFDFELWFNEKNNKKIEALNLGFYTIQMQNSF